MNEYEQMTLEELIHELTRPHHPEFLLSNGFDELMMEAVKRLRSLSLEVKQLKQELKDVDQCG